MNLKLLFNYNISFVLSLDVTMAIEYPLKRVSKIASRAGADSATEMLAGKILREAIRLRVNVGKDPDGLAAAALDLAARIRGSTVMQRDLAKAAGGSEVTIRSRRRDRKVAAKSLGLPDVP